MRFVDVLNGKESDGFSFHACCTGYNYMKYENGVISVVSARNESEYEDGSNFDFTFENVVCGSIIMFNWVCDWNNGAEYGVIHVEGAEIGYLDDYVNAMNETTAFITPTEPNAVCTVYLSGEGGFGDW
jgi:hypothetical protein